ncbi:MAG: hypothetical protein WBZ36_30745 [Candidatus Nitrosopolaris sp.]
MSEINHYLTGKKSKARKKEPWHYWICQKRQGKLADVMKGLDRV